MAARFTIVGLGEALYDLFPDGERLGGAPLNCAVQAHQLGRAVDVRGAVVSRVGQDELGRRLIEQLKSLDMTTDFIQSDPEHDTGRVFVHMNDTGGHSFEIVEDAAWDHLQFDPDVEHLAGKCQAVCFGSLAQRSGVARDTIVRFLGEARRAIRMFDVNLRQHYHSPRILRRSCELASAVKLNIDELPVVVEALGLPGGRALEQDARATDEPARHVLRQFDLDFVALTRGEAGTVVYTGDDRVEAEVPSCESESEADTVGAGDACSAGLLVGRCMRLPWTRTVALANHAGAYVAGRRGATPAMPEEILKLLTG